MQTLVIDGRHFAIEFAGFHRPLRARMIADDDAAGTTVELPPWRCRDHLRALRASLRAGAEGLGLDASIYADDVLAQRETESETAAAPAQLRGLALWWASGREPDDRREPAPRVNAEGWVGLDGRGTAARLRPWTWGERLRAEQAHLSRPSAEHFDFDAVAYLEAMVADCLLALRGPEGQGEQAVDWTDLDAQAGRRLLAALAELNHPEAATDPLLGLSPALAASTLRLCAALGWTPERVLATSAAEVQRLLSLLDRVGGPAPARGRPRPTTTTTTARRRGRPSVADHPDAVVIRFVADDEDDGGRR